MALRVPSKPHVRFGTPSKLGDGYEDTLKTDRDRNALSPWHNYNLQLPYRSALCSTVLHGLLSHACPTHNTITRLNHAHALRMGNCFGDCTTRASSSIPSKNDVACCIASVSFNQRTRTLLAILEAQSVALLQHEGCLVCRQAFGLLGDGFRWR